jgi:hypothetical protein
MRSRSCLKLRLEWEFGTRGEVDDWNMLLVFPLVPFSLSSTFSNLLPSPMDAIQAVLEVFPPELNLVFHQRVIFCLAGG